MVWVIQISCTSCTWTHADHSEILYMDNNYKGTLELKASHKIYKISNLYFKQRFYSN